MCELTKWTKWRLQRCTKIQQWAVFADSVLGSLGLNLEVPGCVSACFVPLLIGPFGEGGGRINKKCVFDLTAVSVDCRNKKEGAVHYLPLFGIELIASGWIQEIRFSAEVFQQRERLK